MKKIKIILITLSIIILITIFFTYKESRACIGCGVQMKCSSIPESTCQKTPRCENSNNMSYIIDPSHSCPNKEEICCIPI